MWKRDLTQILLVLPPRHYFVQSVEGARAERRGEKVAAKKVEIALQHRYWSPTKLDIEIQYQVISE